VIETRQLTKRYGDLIAVNHIDLNLAEGDVFGFIGPNGSGKTTTMRMIATLLQPDYGEAYVCGKSIYTHPQEIRRLIGFMPDFFGVYEDMTVVEYLEFFAAAYRVVPDKRRKVVEEKLELVDMARWSTSSREVRRSASVWPESCCTSLKFCCSMNLPAVWILERVSKFATCSNGSAS
jgi:ABC-type multidrug transport system ATPase subunit